MASELLLIRHGESEANVGLSKDPNCNLTPNGVLQAGELGRKLAKYDLREFSGLVSPYARARQTAAEITAETQIAFTVEPLIREWGDVATVEGTEYPKESVDQLAERLRDFLKRYEERKLIVISHAAPIAVMTQLAWGEMPHVRGEFWAGIPNCCQRWLRTTHA